MPKYKVYPEYKNSGIEWLGPIPDHWKTFSGKRMFKSVRIPADKGDEQLAASQRYGVIPQSLMMQLNDSKVMLALKGTDSFRHVAENDFVISLRSFEGGIEHSQYTGCVSPAYTVLKNSKPISYGYYRYLFKCMPFIAALQSSTDSLRDGKSINYEQFSAIDLPLTSLYEQNTIAAFLDYETAKIDKLIEKQKQLIELLKEKRQAVISHAVTKGLNPDVPMKDSGVEWLGEVPQHWNITKGGYIGRLFGSETVSESNISDEGGLPFIKVSTLSLDSFTLNEPEWFIKTLHEKKYKSECDYIAFPKRGAAIFTNKVNVVRMKSIIDPNLMGWKMNSGVSDEYIAFVLKKRGLSDIADVSTVPQINNKHISPEKFPLPPYKEQLEIVDYLKVSIYKFDNLIDTTQKTIEFSQERRIALISAAVTGKIDVRDWVAPITQEVKEPQETTV